MNKMTDKDIYLQVGRMSVMGKRQPKKEIYDNNSLLTKKQKEIMEGESMSTDQYITMVEYAKYLPRGFRKLKLNYPELRDMLVSKELMKTPLDKTSGLSKGGKVAYIGTKALSQKEHLATILNKNKPKNAMFKKSKLSQQYSNPDYSYFKNNIKV